VPFSLEHGGQILAALAGEPLVALLDHRNAGGQVLVLADVGILAPAGASRQSPLLAEPGPLRCRPELIFTRTCPRRGGFACPGLRPVQARETRPYENGITCF